MPPLAWPLEKVSVPDSKSQVSNWLPQRSVLWWPALGRGLVGLERCQDRSFLRLIDLLRGW